LKVVQRRQVSELVSKPPKVNADTKTYIRYVSVVKHSENNNREWIESIFVVRGGYDIRQSVLKRILKCTFES